jgi:class 3 adenylate cyclase
MLAAMLGKFEEAHAHFTEAVQFEEAQGARPWAAYSKFEFARMLRRRSGPGDLDRALKLAREVYDMAKGLDMKVLEVRAGVFLAKATRSTAETSENGRSRGIHSTERPRQRIIATIMFVDIVASTERVAQLTDRPWVELRSSFFELLREKLRNFRGREIETAGDSMLALFNHPAVAIQAAFAMVHGAQTLGLHVRAGIHTGEIELVDGDAIGIAVHIGARVAAYGGSNEVIVSGTVRDMLAGGDIKFADRGTHVLKGVPGEWRLYTVESLPGA